jgi:hypothetical protein
MMGSEGEVIVAVRPGWRERDRCGICRRRSPGYDRVNLASWRAHGTAQTTTPWRRQRTRGASASTNANVVPRSSARHRRRP